MCRACSLGEGTAQVRVLSRPQGRQVLQGLCVAPLLLLREEVQLVAQHEAKFVAGGSNVEGQIWDVYTVPMATCQSFKERVTRHQCFVYCAESDWAF